MNKNLKLMVSIIGNDKLSGSLRSIIGLGQTGSQKLALMKRGASDLEKELRGVRREIGGSSGNITELLDREAKLERQVEQTNRQMKRQAELVSVENTVKRVNQKGADLRTSGASDMAEGAAMAAPLIFAARSAMGYEKRVALLGQKLEMTSNDAGDFGRQLLGIAAATKQSSDAMLSSADFLSGKGLNARVLNAMLPDIGKFATAWDADVVDASKAAYAGYLSLKVPLDQTARSLEIMAAAGQKGGFEVKDMAKYFPQLSASLATFGSRGLTAVADLSAALQVLEAKTGDGAQAANNLDNLMSFVKSKEGIKNFKQFGIDIPAALKKAEKEGRSPLETIIGLVNRATGGDTSKIPQIIGDRQAGAAALALVDSMKQYKEIKAQALSSLGMTEQEYNRMSKTADANFTAMKTSLTTLGLTLGSTLLPLVVSGTDQIAHMVTVVSNWAAANPETAHNIMMVVTSLIGLKLGMGAVKIAVGGTIGPFATAWGWYKKVSDLAGGFKAWGGAARVMTGVGGAVSRVSGIARGAFGLLSSGVTKSLPFVLRGFALLRGGALMAAKGVMRAGAMMMANPILLIIAAIAAAVYLIYANWDTLGPYFLKAWNAVKGFFSSGINAIVEFASTLWPRVKGFLVGWIVYLRPLPGMFMEIGGDLIQGLINGVTSRLGALKSTIVNAASAAANWFKQKLGIHSPSRVFAQIGGHVMAGLDQGLAANASGPLSRITDLSGQMTRALSAGAIGTAMATASPAAASAASTATPPPVLQATYHINITAGVGASATDIADEVRKALEAIENERRGRGFGDE